MRCTNCKEEIPKERLKVLPKTKTCVNCSGVLPYRGFVSGTPEHKGTELTVLEGDSHAVDYMEDNYI